MIYKLYKDLAGCDYISAIQIAIITDAILTSERNGTFFSDLQESLSSDHTLTAGQMAIVAQAVLDFDGVFT